MDILKIVYNLFLESNGVEIDSRKIVENKIFFVLPGTKVDAHIFVQDILKKPNVYAVISNKDFYVDDRTIVVSDTLKFLQDLARHHREQFKNPVLAITGSNGKTTTKELVTCALAKKFHVHATAGNFNNHIGVPLTILSAPKMSEMWVIEMGANHINDIDFLCNIALPTHGLITNIGSAHLEGFGSLEGVIQAKTELYKFLQASGGMVFYNENDPILVKELDGFINEKVPYPSNKLRIEDSGMRLKLVHQDSQKSYHSMIYGIYNAINIQAAFSISDYFEIEHSTILEALSEYLPKMNRSQILEKDNSVIIMDAYNANPSSMKLSIESLANLKDLRKKVLILGDMLELGKTTESAHLEIIQFVKKHEWYRIFLVGKIFANIPIEGHRKFIDVSELVTHFKKNDSELKDAIILLKGSRSIQLEKFLEIYE